MFLFFRNSFHFIIILTAVTLVYTSAMTDSIYLIITVVSITFCVDLANFSPLNSHLQNCIVVTEAEVWFIQRII